MKAVLMKGSALVLALLLAAAGAAAGIWQRLKEYR